MYPLCCGVPGALHLHAGKFNNGIIVSVKMDSIIQKPDNSTYWKILLESKQRKSKVNDVLINTWPLKATLPDMVIIIIVMTVYIIGALIISRHCLFH